VILGSYFLCLNLSLALGIVQFFLVLGSPHYGCLGGTLRKCKQELRGSSSEVVGSWGSNFSLVR